MSFFHRIAVLTILPYLAACGVEPTYTAELYRSEGGVPHIVAGDFASLAYGTGYAAAEDNLCILARHFLRLNARLSAHFGPGNGNLESDLFYQLMQDLGQYRQDADAEFEAMFRGYAAGYNRYLRDTGVDTLPDPECRGASWVTEISAQDSRNAHLNPFFLAAFRDMVVSAAPPGDAPPTVAQSQVRAGPADRRALGDKGDNGDKGSNGVAIGRKGAASGNALLFANPHLDWRPDQRFYPLHQVIPGEMNLLGATLFDRASVGIGTNGSIAWTNTVSTARRFTFYQVQLQPDDPTSYLLDGEVRSMQRRQVSVPVRKDDGSIGEHLHTFFTTHFGHLVGGFPWTDQVAFALRISDEANRGINGATTAQYRATTVHELKAVHDRFQFQPSNLIAADVNGDVLYGDYGPVAYLDDAQLAACAVLQGRALDGSRSECHWQSSPDAVADGILPPAMRPSIVRDDFVTNSNDSYWLANPLQPITGLPQILGRIETERTLRTRSGLALVQNRIAGEDGREGSGFTLENLIDVLMSNENMAGQLLRDDLVTLCETNPDVALGAGQSVDIRPACNALAGWDLHANLDSRGAHLFREFIREANSIAGPTDWPRILPRSLNFREPFDLDRPLTTPYGLDTDDNPNALIALARAVRKLEDAGIALDARLGDIQGVTKNGDFIPLHGGPEIEGVFNKMEFDFEGSEGYPAVTGSSGSWIMGIELGDDGPHARGILSYSISGNRESPHFADMTRRLSAKEFVDLPYTVRDVQASAISSMTLTEGADDCGDDGWRQFISADFADETECRELFRALSEKRLKRFVSAPPAAR